MNGITREIVQAAVIDTIKRKHNVTYTDIANSIEVHRSHIQKVSKCVRPLSEEKFQQLCKTWHIDIQESLKRMELDEQHAVRWKTVKKLLESRNLNLYDLHLQTGINYLDLTLMMQGKKELSDEHCELIAKILDVNSKTITDQHVSIVFELIQKGLWSLHIEQAAIEAVLKFVEIQL